VRLPDRPPCGYESGCGGEVTTHRVQQIRQRDAAFLGDVPSGGHPLQLGVQAGLVRKQAVGRAGTQPGARRRLGQHARHRASHLRCGHCTRHRRMGTDSKLGNEHLQRRCQHRGGTRVVAGTSSLPPLSMGGERDQRCRCGGQRTTDDSPQRCPE